MSLYSTLQKYHLSLPGGSPFKDQLQQRLDQFLF